MTPAGQLCQSQYGEYVAWFQPALEVTDKAFEVDAASLKEAAQALDLLASYTLWLADDAKAMKDYSNAGGVIRIVNGVSEDVDEDEVREALQ